MRPYVSDPIRTVFCNNLCNGSSIDTINPERAYRYLLRPVNLNGQESDEAQLLVGVAPEQFIFLPFVTK